MDPECFSFLQIGGEGPQAMMPLASCRLPYHSSPEPPAITTGLQASSFRTRVQPVDFSLQQDGAPLPAPPAMERNAPAHSTTTITVRPADQQMSKLLKVFTNDQTGFELEDLKGYFVEFSRDQHGSRFLQKELEVVDSDMVQLVFEEVLPVLRNLMVDVYGNYVVQKFFDFGTDEQRMVLAGKLRGTVVPLSLHLYGCRVIQKALETLPDYLQVRGQVGRLFFCVKTFF